LNETVTYSVPDISSGHCRAAISAEVTAVAGVHSVDVDLDRKLVHVSGSALDDPSIRRAIHEAGYAAAEVTKERG
jgi:copper chaperone